MGPLPEPAGLVNGRFGMVSVLVVTVMVMSTGARPYEDTRGRFKIQPASGWRLAPRFGDVRGTAFEFEKRPAGIPARFTLWADKLEEGLDPWRALESELRASTTIQRQRDLPRMQIGGVPADVRRYQGRRGANDVVVRAHVFAASDFRYTLWWEASLRKERQIARQVARMLASFQPAAPRNPSPLPAKKEELQRSVVGRWQSDEGVVLELRKNGTFRLADVKGQYRVQGKQLELRPRDGTPQRFSIRWEQNALLLTNPVLQRPLRYRPSSAVPKPQKITHSWVGIWRARKVPSVELELGPGGNFKLGRYQGQWMEDDGYLRLRLGPRQVLSYRFRFEGKALVLEGADLDDALVLDRK